MSGGARKNADDALLIVLASGATVAAAASQAGVSEATVYRRLNDAAFRARVDEARLQTVQAAIDSLSATGAAAALTLRQLLLKEYPPAVRLGAARAVLELGTKLREAHELEARLVALETRLADDNGRRP